MNVKDLLPQWNLIPTCSLHLWSTIFVGWNTSVTQSPVASVVVGSCNRKNSTDTFLGRVGTITLGAEYEAELQYFLNGPTSFCWKNSDDFSVVDLLFFLGWLLSHCLLTFITGIFYPTVTGDKFLDFSFFFRYVSIARWFQTTKCVKYLTTIFLDPKFSYQRKLFVVV